MVAAVRPPLYPSTRTSPYFQRTEAVGAVEYIVYNHMYMPLSYGRDPREEYRAVTEAVALWDVGAQRQTELRGLDALELASYLTTRSLEGLGRGHCRYTVCCDNAGEIICDPVLIVPEDDVVWLSHGTVDLTLWALAWALAGDRRVTVSEPDIAPMQVQGPLSPDVIGALLGPDATSLGRFRCALFTIAGVECVVSRTGWSGGDGFEVYPLGSESAVDVWDAIVAAGDRYGLLVAGPNLANAMEAGITDTSYATNDHMNPLELWQEFLVDHDKGDFVGREALARIRDAGISRRQVGLLGPAGPLPRMERFWDVSVDGRSIGATRWLTRSYALDRMIAVGLVDASFAEPGQRVMVSHPEGEAAFDVTTLPFVR
jgi:glycine cleavage system aminomethyltransferase T